VVIPAVIVGVRHFRPDHFDDLCSGFDKTTGEETALSEGVAPVGIAQFRVFGIEVEGIASAPGNNQVQGFVIVFIEIVAFDRFFNDGHLIRERITKFCTAL
jgi:hypothetical protein